MGTFKSLDTNDSSFRKIEVNASHTLTHATAGVDFFSGYSASANYISSSNWNWINCMFYNLEIGQLAGYKSHFYQNRNLDITASIVTFPLKQTGYKIKPGTFWYEETDGSIITTLQDDASGNLYDTSGASGSDYIKGNVFYYHSTIVLTDTASQYQSLGNSSQFKFRSVHYIYEHSYNCHIGEGEMLGSTNPTAIWGSDSSSTHPSNELRRTNFFPYITTIGLYDDQNRLLVIGKLARPIKNDPEQKMNFKIKFDM